MKKTIYIVLIGFLLVVSSSIFLLYKWTMCLGCGPIPELQAKLHFKANIENRVEIIRPNRGSMEVEMFEVSKDVDKICFDTKGKIILTKNDDVYYNLSLNHVRIDNDFCIKPDKGNFKIKLSGLGDMTKIEPLDS